MNEYGDEKYWNQRYESQKGRTYDWLVTFQELKPVFQRLGNHFGKGSRVLNVGCGNGVLNEDMHDRLGCHLVNIDLSEQVIQQMANRNKQARSSMVFETMDAQKLRYGDSTFESVIDKCTIDGIMCSEDYLLTAHRVIMEIFRVLKIGGVYLMISYSSSSHRRYLLQRRCMVFSVVEQTIEKEGRQYYLYTCTKEAEYDTHLQQLNLEVEKQVQAELEQEKAKSSNLLVPKCAPTLSFGNSQPTKTVSPATQQFDPFSP